MSNRKVVQPQLDPLRYLKARGSKWHYVRRVPAHFAMIDGRGTIQISLKTSSLDVAKLRRDALERADDLFWQGLALDDQAKSAHARYAAAKARAVALGFEYKAAAEIAETATVEEIIRRITAATTMPQNERAVLGGADNPKDTVRQAFELYKDEIAVNELQGMSPTQVDRWKKSKLQAVNRFCDVVSNKAFLDIDRADALKFYNSWMEQIKNGARGSSGNRSMGTMRKFFREYTRHLQLKIENPFDNLIFANPKHLRRKVLPFDPAYVAETFLKGDNLRGLNREARHIFLAMVETGCRPSELCNLLPEHIHLDGNVPYISVRYTTKRKLKTGNSIRDVPLVGISLEIMRLNKNGFTHYFDKEDTLSDTVMTFLKNNELLPTEDHRMYSLRHTYEKRMLEAGYDDEFRRRTLGHDTDRPEYGDGGSLAWRAEKMAAIALSFDEAVLA